MRAVFEQVVVFDRPFRGIGEVEELMIDQGLTAKRHDVAGFALSIALFLASQVITHVRSVVDKKGKQAAEQRLLSEIDARLKKYVSSGVRPEESLAQILAELQIEGTLQLQFDGSQESDLQKSVEQAASILRARIQDDRR
jgi:hypothetical protein